MLPNARRAAKQGEHLCTKYEIVYHARERVRLPHYLGIPRPMATALRPGLTVTHTHVTVSPALLTMAPVTGKDRR
ncbi:hypothetical protein SUDANB67_05660 (plasmid) [Nocardiopsis dassonvillei]